jgi:hypothetical protein
VHIDESGRHIYNPLALLGPDNNQLDGLSPTMAFSGVISATLSNNGRLPVVKPIGDITEGNEPFLTLAAIPYTRLEPGSSYLKPLLDVQALNSSLSSAFAGILSLLVSEQMLRPVNDSIRGSFQYSEHRLHVEKIPAIVITTLLLSCFILALGMLCVLPSNVVPTNPNSIGGTATIVGPIPELRFLSQTTFEKIVIDTTSQDFKSIIFTAGVKNQRDQKFNIVSTSAQPERRPRSDIKEAKFNCWCPFTLRTWVRASTIALCLGMITALELLQRKSDRSDGFMKTVSSTNVQLWATVLPALALTGLALLYSSIYTNTSILAPYHALTKKTGEAAKPKIWVAHQFLPS